MLVLYETFSADSCHTSIEIKNSNGKVWIFDNKLAVFIPFNYTVL